MATQQQAVDRLTKTLPPSSACRGCGVSTTTRERVSGWRCCDTCLTWLRGDDHAGMWRDVLGDLGLTDAEGMLLTRRCGNPIMGVRGQPSRPGHRKRWDHLTREQLAGAAATLSRHRDTTTVRTHPGGPCTVCGVLADAGWTEPASEHRRPVCGRCGRMLARHGWPSLDERDDVITALALGFPALYGLGRACPVATWADLGASEGSDVPWGHIDADSRSQARARVAVAYPSLRRHLTDTERAAADALTAAQHTPAPTVPRLGATP